MLSLNLPQISRNVPTPWPRSRPALRKQARPPQKGGLKSAGTMPKSHPLRNAMGRKNHRFRKVFASNPAISTKILEMAKRRARQRQLRALCVQKLRRGFASDNAPDPVDRDPRSAGGLSERFEGVRGNRAQNFVVVTARHDLTQGDRSRRERGGRRLRQGNGRKLYCCGHGGRRAELGEIASQPV